MPTSSSARWIVTMSLFSLSAMVMCTASVHSESAGGAAGPPAGSHESFKAGKSGKHENANPADAARAARPPDKPGRGPVAREQTAHLEERLQQGQMEEAVAQGQVSDRLEQLHKGPTAGLP